MFNHDYSLIKIFLLLKTLLLFAIMKKKILLPQHINFEKVKKDNNMYYFPFRLIHSMKRKNTNYLLHYLLLFLLQSFLNVRDYNILITNKNFV